jgi:hypothetical protein
MIGGQRLVAGLHDRELVLEAFEVLEAQAISLRHGLVTRLAQPPGPEVERLGRRDAPADPVHHPLAGPSTRSPRELEERQVRAGASVLVRVEEVVDARLVLVHRLLHHPQAEETGIELDV